MRDKILSQQEIEALTAALMADTEGAVAETADSGEGVAPTKSAKVYDFRRPDKFSKEHLRSLRILHETFARLLSSTLTNYLSTAVQVRLTMVEQVTYDEYVNSLPTPTVIYIVGMSPLNGQIVVELNLPVARALMDRLLGGNGQLGLRVGELTDIEFILLKTIGNFVNSSLREAWTNVIPLRPTIQQPVLSPELAQFATLGETTIMLVLEISIFRTTGTLSMCIPYPVLQPIMDNLSQTVWLGGQRSGAEDEEADTSEQTEQMGQVVVPITAELGHGQLTVGQILNLTSGQVIKLDTAADGALPVRVGEHVKFLARPGLNGKNRAVQIVQAVPST